MKRAAMITTGILPVPAIRGGAVETLSTYLVEGFAQDGQYELDVFTKADKGLDKARYRNVHIIQVRPTKWDDYRELWFGRFQRHLHINAGFGAFQYALRRGFDPSKYELILFENGMRNVCALKRRKKSGTWVYHAHNGLEGKLGDKSKKNLAAVQNTCDLILACSNYLRRSFQPYVKKCAMRTYYNALDLEHYVKKYQENKSVREKYGIGTDDFVFLYSGRIVPEKGVLEAVRAFAELGARKAKLVIVGDLNADAAGDPLYVKKVRAAIHKKGIAGRTVLTGYVSYEDMPYIYGMADCVLVPSQWEETFGMVVIEAMAMHKPLIVAKSGGIAEIVDSSCAVIVDRGSGGIPQIAEGMKELYLNPSKARQMGENGFRRLCANKAWQKAHYFENFMEALGNVQ